MNYDDVEKLLKDYHFKYRNPILKELSVSKKYDLFPTKKRSENCWPHTYPHADEPGVYLIMDSEKNVIHIGKSSVAIGQILGSHFRYSKDGTGECQNKSPYWLIEPKYLATIPVSVNSSFEAASLKEFLISKLGK